jgi:hypothetical protein
LDLLNKENAVTKLAQWIGPLAVVLVLGLSNAPAHAQFGGLGGMGGTSGGDMMTTMAPMLEMMKKKMGERRFAQLMQTVGPMASQMMDQGGGFNFNSLGGGFGGMGAGQFDMASMQQFISPAMIQSMMSMGKGTRRGIRKARRAY